MTGVILFQKLLFQPMVAPWVMTENIFLHEEQFQCILLASIHGTWGIRGGSLRGIVDHQAGHHGAWDPALAPSPSHSVRYAYVPSVC